MQAKCEDAAVTLIARIKQLGLQMMVFLTQVKMLL